MRTSSNGIGGLFATFPNLSVGSYQRSVVWDGKQKAAFIQSILRDYPTGIIVLNKVNYSGPAGVPKLPGAAVVTHDVIDGQQRLTTLAEFLENPLIYVTDWLPKPPSDPGALELEVVTDVRSEFAATIAALKRVKSGYVPKGMRRPALVEKLSKDAKDDLQRRRMGYVPSRPEFKALIDALMTFFLEVTQKQVVVGELEGWDTAQAEQMYQVINTSGTAMKWWELLRVDDSFVRNLYAHRGAYTTVQDGLVRQISNRYRPKGKLRSYASTHDSFWDAMFALGEYFHYLMAGSDPSVRPTVVRPSERRLKVDGLGFRLASTFLSHDIGRPAINNIFVNYTADEVREAIDALFDAGLLLSDRSGKGAPGFDFFWKYSRTGTDSAPAYPLIGLIVAAAKFVAINRRAGKGRTLTVNDCLNLRALTEELVRESVCSEKWSGTGDSKLKTWLDEHFQAVLPGNGSTFPGSLKSALPTANPAEWVEYLGTLQASGQKTVDKKSMFLSIWIQYLYSSQSTGALPQGEVEFDHIVPFQNSPGSLTTHPLNIAAVSGRLNRAKSKRTFGSWSKSAGEATEYSESVLNKVSFKIAGKTRTGADFLANADHTSIGKMIGERLDVYKLGVEFLLPAWLSNGG